MDKMNLIDRCITNNNGCSISVFETIDNSTGKYIVCASNRGDIDGILFQSDDIDEAIVYYRDIIDAYNRITNIQYKIINRHKDFNSLAALPHSTRAFSEVFDTYGVSYED